jgi:hypothetical protein
MPGTPHMAYLNCDDQPILCSMWSCATGNLWVFEMVPPPSDIDIYRKRLNLTSTTTKTFSDLHASKDGGDLKPLDSIFHPFNSKVAKAGLSLPIGYALWAFNLVPNWLFMLVISFVSRSMMSKRMNNHMNRQDAAAAGGPAVPPQAAR